MRIHVPIGRCLISRPVLYRIHCNALFSSSCIRQTRKRHDAPTRATMDPENTDITVRVANMAALTVADANSLPSIANSLRALPILFRAELTRFASWCARSPVSRRSLEDAMGPPRDGTQCFIRDCLPPLHRILIPSRNQLIVFPIAKPRRPLSALQLRFPSTSVTLRCMPPSSRRKRTYTSVKLVLFQSTLGKKGLLQSPPDL